MSATTTTTTQQQLPVPNDSKWLTSSLGNIFSMIEQASEDERNEVLDWDDTDEAEAQAEEAQAQAETDCEDEDDDIIVTGFYEPLLTCCICHDSQPINSTHRLNCCNDAVYCFGCFYHKHMDRTQCSLCRQAIPNEQITIVIE